MLYDKYANWMPKTIDKNEILEYFIKFKNGDVQSREKIITYNLRLVPYIVTNKFQGIDYDKDELISIGIIGLIKAVDTFKIEKKIEFTTYASRCICNEILMVIRKNKKRSLDNLLGDVIVENGNGEKLTLEEILPYDEYVDEVYEKKEIKAEIVKILEKLPERDKKIVMLYFGFIGDRTYSQAEISNIFGLSQSYITRVLKKNLETIREELIKAEIVEMGYLEINFNIIVETLTKILKIYSEEQISSVIKNLSMRDKTLLQKVYCSRNIEEEIKLLYQEIIPKVISNIIEGKNDFNIKGYKKNLVRQVILYLLSSDEEISKKSISKLLDTNMINVNRALIKKQKK